MSSLQEITSSLDDYIRERDIPYWKAELSNGTTVYDDDDRPGLTERSAWKRLVSYCNANSLSVEKVTLIFRSNQVVINTSEWDGVFFIKSVVGHIKIAKNGMPMPIRRFPSRLYHNIGRVYDDKIVVSKYELPVMVWRTDEDREIGELEQRLIIRNVKV